MLKLTLKIVPCRGGGYDAYVIPVMGSPLSMSVARRRGMTMEETRAFVTAAAVGGKLDAWAEQTQTVCP